MTDPDEDEDASRTCVKCGTRPRWSKHWSCTRCAKCAGKAVRWCLMHRKISDEPIATLKNTARNLDQRERYRILRQLGASAKMAAGNCQSRGIFERASAQLREARQ